MKRFTVKLCALAAGVMALGGAAATPGGFATACARDNCPRYCQCIFDGDGRPVFCTSPDCFDCVGNP